MSKTKEMPLEYDFRPRVDEATSKRIHEIAARDGSMPSALIRKWILEGIRRDDAMRLELSKKGLFFSVASKAP